MRIFFKVKSFTLKTLQTILIAFFISTALLEIGILGWWALENTNKYTTETTISNSIGQPNKNVFLSAI
jgi:hypothetical protein